MTDYRDGRILSALMRSENGKHTAVWVKDGKLIEERVGRHDFAKLFYLNEERIGHVESGPRLEATFLFEVRS